MEKEIELAIIGDLAFNKDITPYGEKTSMGGSAYYSAVGASKYCENVGIVAKVGDDFDLEYLEKRKINIEGVKIVKGGQTARFVLYQHQDGNRDFKAERGVAVSVDTSIFPRSYLNAKYIHLATSLPEHYLVWINVLRTQISSSTIISADAFEQYVKEYPDLTREVLKLVGMIFLNEEELNLLSQFGELSFRVPIILKKGPLGAVYIEGEKTIRSPAPRVKAIETTGAGDILAGVFLALRAGNFPVEKALEEAVKTASYSVTEFGVEHL